MISILLPDRLRLLRQEKKLTQLAMARKILVPRVTYTHYELGRRTPDLETIIRLADFHQVSVDYLIGFSQLRPTLEQWLIEQNNTVDSQNCRNVYTVNPDLSGQKVADQLNDPFADADSDP